MDRHTRAAQLAGQVPARLDTYPTAVTEALDSAVITPSSIPAANVNPLHTLAGAYGSISAPFTNKLASSTFP